MAKGILDEIKADAADNWLSLAEVEAAIPAMKAKGCLPSLGASSGQK